MAAGEQEEWRISLKEIRVENNGNRQYSRLFRHGILDKAFHVTLVLNDDIFEYTIDNWIAKKATAAEMEPTQKYTVCVYAEEIDASLGRFLFSFCCGNEILVWFTRQMDPLYCLRIEELLMHDDVMTIVSNDKTDLAALRKYFGPAVGVHMQTVSEVLQRRIARVRARFRQLRNMGMVTAIDLQLQSASAVEETAKYTMDKVCNMIMGLPLPNILLPPHTIPPLMQRLCSVAAVSEVHVELVKYSSVKVSLLHVLVSSLGGGDEKTI